MWKPSTARRAPPGELGGGSPVVGVDGIGQMGAGEPAWLLTQR